jgi:hypothetical protein
MGKGKEKGKKVGRVEKVDPSEQQPDPWQERSVEKGGRGNQIRKRGENSERDSKLQRQEREARGSLK